MNPAISTSRRAGGKSAENHQPPLGMNGEGIVGRNATVGRHSVPPSFNTAGNGVNVFVARLIFYDAPVL
jgi:hypothetical protein